MNKPNYFTELVEQTPQSWKKPVLPTSDDIIEPGLDALPTPRMTNEVIELFHALSSLLPLIQGHALEFLGSCEDEGTSTVVSEFALAIHKKFNKSVLVLDADPLRLSQHAYFNVNPGVDWVDIEKSDQSLEKAIYPLAGPEFCISLLSAHGYANMLSNGFLLRSMAYLKDKFDFVIIDSPPIGNHSLGVELCRCVDGVVLVIAADKTRWPVAQAIKRKVMREGGNILGIVFNKRQHYIPNFIYRHL